MKSIALIFTRSKERTGQGSGIQRASIPIALVGIITYLKKKKVPVYLIDEKSIKSLRGDLAIGHVRYSTTGSSHASNIQPCIQ